MGAKWGQPYKKTQPASYRRFVEAGIRDMDAAFVETKRRSRFCIGSDESHERIESMYHEMIQAYDRKEDVSFRCEGGYASVDKAMGLALEILGVPREALCHRGMNSMIRPVVAYALCQYAGCTQRAAAQLMGLRSGVAVSLQLKRLHERSKSDRELRLLIKKLNDRFS